MQEALADHFSERDELDDLRAALAASGDVIYDWNLADDQLRFFAGAERVLGVAGLESGIEGEAFERLLNPEDVPLRRVALANHRVAGQPYDCEYRVRNDAGEYHWVHDRGVADFAPDGGVLRLRGVLRVITQRKQVEARLEYLTSYDELTGHYNRERLRETLERTLAYATRYGISGGYLTVGIDRLSLLGEAFDYRTVNAVVIEVGNRLDRCLRASDVVGRIGDDSFGVVLAQCGEDELPVAAEKVLETMRSTSIETPSGPLHVTVSLGCVAFPQAGQTAHDVMAKGEVGLQAARRTGRDSYYRYELSEEERQDHRRSVAMAEEVQIALREGRIFFAYQPVVTASDNGVAFHECLLRMRRPDGELVPAGVFVPVVEQLGLVTAIDRRALELAVRDLQDHADLELAINVSSITTFDRSWFRLLASLVKGRPDIARRLIIEITETMAVPDVEEMARFVVALRELGCRVALDDFGAGYTSFRHLQALTVDVVKIDGAFVRNVADNPDNQHFIRTLLSLAEGFGLVTVAECVETAKDAALLASHGVTYLQGWHCGKPTVEPTWRRTPAVTTPPRAKSVVL
jgi:diguanylate cyclase (GGDEF)-like protein